MICQSWLKGLRRGVFPAPVAVVPFPLRAEAFFVYAVKSLHITVLLCLNIGISISAPPHISVKNPSSNAIGTTNGFSSPISKHTRM